MLFRQSFLDGIRAGTITLAFRRWRRPTVKAGGTLLTPVGQLEIVAVDPVALAHITAVDAKRAGYASLASLHEELEQRPDGEVYRITLGALRPDPRLALRETPAHDAHTVHALREALERLDARAPHSPWTERTLHLLRASPGVRAGDLCEQVGLDKDDFKRNVRKLKNLGLTESLGTGYRLSPRGEALLEALGAARSRRAPRAP